ncbi:MAG: hypothetical protein IJL63_09815 [Clostridia bacterium]|nr:hypothetical protein [Clostridia bacterium]
MEKKAYTDKVHTWGKIWSLSALAVLYAVPLVFSVRYNVFPQLNLLLKALSAVIPIYWGTAIVEVLTYTPMLGAGGTYLSFVSGNIANLKLPCAMNAMDRAKVTASSEEGELISTIAIGVSAITTTVIIAVGVLLFLPFAHFVTDEGSAIKPAFENVIPALFGALGASYFSKYWKLSILPITAGVIAYIFLPTLPVGTMIFITIVVSLAGAFGMYKLGWVKGE